MKKMNAFFYTVAFIAFLHATAAANEFRLNICEYSVVFPMGYTTKETTVGDITQLIAEYKDVPYFKAECLPVKDRPLIRGSLDKILVNMAKLSGFLLPQTTIEEQRIGTVGTYVANRKIAGHDVKLFVKVFLGERSLFHVMVMEELGVFPSAKSILFVDSVKKIR